MSSFSSNAVLWCGVLCVFVVLTGATVSNGEQGLDDWSADQQVDRRNTSAFATMADLNIVITALVKMQKQMNSLTSGAKKVPWLRGSNGRDGKPGRNGRDGKLGRNGRDGRPGRDGRDGKPGVNDLRGPKGAAGATGRAGPRGPPGSRGRSGVQYVRWGKTSCPSGVQLVYKGRVGGEHYNNPGGAAQYVCLPETPQYLRYTPGHQTWSGHMYGAEYEVNERTPLSQGTSLHDHDVPCAVCYVTSRISQMMIPATYLCPAGWTREYYGYLMTENYNHKHPSQFVCVDNGAEYVPGTQANHNGALLYPVEGRCGSLPCAPYVAGRELTCVVCTK